MHQEQNFLLPRAGRLFFKKEALSFFAFPPLRPAYLTGV
jgi:hypothetical protein